jgi:hypothetical protein
MRLCQRAATGLQYADLESDTGLYMAAEGNDSCYVIDYTEA